MPLSILCHSSSGGILPDSLPVLIDVVSTTFINWHLPLLIRQSWLVPRSERSVARSLQCGKYCRFFPSLNLLLFFSLFISPSLSLFFYLSFSFPFFFLCFCCPFLSLSLSPSHFFLCCRCYFIWPSVEQLRAAAVGGKRVCATTTSSSVYAQQLSRPITEPLCCGVLLGAGLFTGRSVVTGSCLVLCVTRLLTCIRRGYDQFIVDAVSDVPFGCCCQEGHPFPPIPVFEIQQNS